jgi:hypothetical protein
VPHTLIRSLAGLLSWWPRGSARAPIANHSQYDTPFKYGCITAGACSRDSASGTTLDCVNVWRNRKPSYEEKMNVLSLKIGPPRVYVVKSSHSSSPRREACYASRHVVDVAELEQIQRELQRRGELERWDCLDRNQSFRPGRRGIYLMGSQNSRPLAGSARKLQSSSSRSK